MRREGQDNKDRRLTLVMHISSCSIVTGRQEKKKHNIKKSPVKCCFYDKRKGGVKMIETDMYM